MDMSTINNTIMNSSLGALEYIASQLLNDCLPSNYISSLKSDQDKIDTLHACLIIYILTATKIVLRSFQLQASLATLNGRDTIAIAGTGSDKTYVTEVGRVQSHGSPFSLEDSLGRSGRTCQGTLYEVDSGNTSNILRP